MIENKLILERIENIDKALDESLNYSTDLSLLTGLGGLPLFYVMAYKLTNNKQYLVKIRNVVEDLFDKLNNTSLSMAYSSGITGLAYMFEFLRENNFLEPFEIDEGLEILDDLILEYTLTPIIDYADIDFMHGKLGSANYLFKRISSNKKVERNIHVIFENLANFIEKEIDKTVATNSLDVINESTHRTNCGLAHGHISSILIFSKYLEVFPNKEYIKSVLRRSVKCVLGFKTDDDSELAAFPSIAINKTSATYNIPLGWCYGDQTISLGLYRASQVLNDKCLESEAKNIAFRTLRRDTFDKALSFSSDAGFCHGASSLAYLHKKWHEITEDTKFNSLYKRFFDVIIKKGEDELGVGGYRKNLGNGKLTNSIGLLDGIIGIGVVLIDSQIDDQQYKWDEFFLLN